MDSNLLDYFKDAKAKCDSCGSLLLLFFVETRVKRCFAYCCLDCHNFQLLYSKEGNLDQLKDKVKEFNKGLVNQ